jgi:putative DNA methylase
MESYKKKLIEVALPLDAINAASAREKSIRHGHPSTLHLWWARRPLAAARAVLFGQLVDDPSAHPELFPTEEDQQKERDRLFGIIEELVKWENTNNESVLNQAREEIRTSWAMTCKETGDDPEKLPAFHDPFAGGGAIPLEAQRLGLEAYASDLNPVAVLINKAMIEIPPKFANMPPVNPESRRQDTGLNIWQGAQGLAEDVRYYGKWMRDEAEKRIGQLYPKVKVTPEMVRERPDLKPYEGRELTVIAWIWARTVKSPNPVFRNIDVPLISTYVLSSKKGKEAWLEPIVTEENYRFAVRMSKPPANAKNGNKLGRGANFQCILSGTPIEPDYIKAEGKAKRIGQKLIAVVCNGMRERIFLEPTLELENVAFTVKPDWKPEQEMNQNSTDLLSGRGYGFNFWSELFTQRQLTAIDTFSSLVQDVYNKAILDIRQINSFRNTKTSTKDDSRRAYGAAIALYMAMAVDRIAMSNNSLVRWNSHGPKAQHCFGRQALPMLWDFAEINPFANATGSFTAAIECIYDPLVLLGNFKENGYALIDNSITQNISQEKIVSTDPPYYDNINYADLSDFFYIWLRKSLKQLFPNLFSTMTVPKADELVATPYRHNGRESAKKFFIEGMSKTLRNLANQAHPSFPVTIYYAFKQAENTAGDTVSTGWEIFLEALMDSQFSITGTWPLRTELSNRMIGMGTNALASSIVLVCQKRSSGSGMTTRRDFQTRLRSELPNALRHLQKGNIAPVDVAQASIGPGMAIFSSYNKVIEADGTPMKVRTALALINEVLDEILAEQEGEMDGDTRWAVAWFEQFGMGEAPYGTAETLCNAKNTSMRGLVDAGIVHSKSGRVHLLRREEMDPDWDPQKDKRLTVWEATQHLIQKLESDGEGAAAELIGKLGGVAEQARDLAYRLFQICERKKWANEARSYNSLVIAWPELTRRAQPKKPTGPEDQSLF